MTMHADGRVAAAVITRNDVQNMYKICKENRVERFAARQIIEEHITLAY